jgi:hypothetical protein
MMATVRLPHSKIQLIVPSMDLGILLSTYLVVFSSGLPNLSPAREILIALGKIRNSPSNLWSSLSESAHMGRKRLLTVVIVT